MYYADGRQNTEKGIYLVDYPSGKHAKKQE